VSREGHECALQNLLHKLGTSSYIIAYAQNYFKIVEMKKSLKKVFCSPGKLQVLTFSNLLHRKAQIEAEFHHGQVS